MAEPVIITPFRGIFNASAEVPSVISADAVVIELHRDELIMTEHPVEQGSVIADHAYKVPQVVELEYGWSGSPPNSFAVRTDKFLRDIYDQLLQLQKNRTLVSVSTGKRDYQSMLIQSVQEETSKETENAMIIRAVCREVILATVSTFILSDSSVQAQPQNTAQTTEEGQKFLFLKSSGG